MSVSGPAVLTMEIPTGYFIDTEELFRIQSEGYNAWSVDEKVVIFFHRVRKIIATVSSIYRLHILKSITLYRDAIDRVLFYIKMTVMMS